MRILVYLIIVCLISYIVPYSYFFVFGKSDITENISIATCLIMTIVLGYFSTKEDKVND